MQYEEILVLAKLVECYEREVVAAKPDEAPNMDRAMKAAIQELRGPGKHFADTEQFNEAGAALLHTGFVIPVSAFGGIAFAPSPRGRKLARMVRLNDWADELYQAQNPSSR